MAAVIHASQLACGYGDNIVLDAIDFEVAAGEVAVLIGPNGSGKSTLIKTLAGLVPALSGEILIQSDPIARLKSPEVARRVAYVPQGENHVFPFTVRQIVEMGALARSSGLWETPEDKARAESAMVETDCDYLAGRSILEVSGGEQQRVLFARALAQDTPILLLDEPTSHLDVRHQVTLLDQVNRLAGEGRAIVLAIHDLAMVGLLTATAYLLNDKKIVTKGPLETVLQSEELDKVYAQRFLRMRDSNDRLRVLADS